jgi:predicted CoA-binding protein
MLRKALTPHRQAAAGLAGTLMQHEPYSNDYIANVLKETRTIAMVGASAHWNRPSFFAMKYLQSKGFRVIPVNPAVAGQKILGETVYASLRDIPDKVDMVDCFRSADSIPPIAEEAIAIGAKVLWMQLGIRNEAAAARAAAAGLKVVMNRCPKIEFGRLSGEIGWMGVNTRVISSKRQKKV